MSLDIDKRIREQANDLLTNIHKNDAAIIAVRERVQEIKDADKHAQILANGLTTNGKKPKEGDEQ